MVRLARAAFDPGRGLIGLREQPAAFGFADGLDDGGGQLDVGPRDHADLLGQVVAGLGAVGPAAGVDKRGLADEDLIAGVQVGLRDLHVVDEGAVGAADVHEHEPGPHLAKLGMPARHLGVMQTDAAGGVSADGQHRLGQIELLALVGPLDDEQTRHSRSRGRLGHEHSPKRHRSGEGGRRLGSQTPV